MPRTTVLNLIGGPGVGKSTVAAQVFAAIKTAGSSAELVSEWVKKWAWEGKTPGAFDQLYILAKQIQAETRLYGRVRWVVTDSPVVLSPVYESLYQRTTTTVEPALSVLRAAEARDVNHVYFRLQRDVPYHQEGRFESAEAAVKVDEALELFLRYHRLPFTSVPSSQAAASIQEWWSRQS